MDLELIKKLDFLEGIIYKKERSFLDTFACSKDATDLISVSFNSTKVKFVYLVSSGAHIAYDAPLDKFYDWFNKITKVTL